MVWEFASYNIQDLFEYIRWLVDLRIFVALAISQPYRDFEARDNQYLNS